MTSGICCACLLGHRKAEVEGEIGAVGGDVGELPAHALLVGGQSLDRRPREADQRHVAMVQVDERAVEPVRQAGAAGAGAERVIRAEHDVVGEQLGAAVEELGEGLLAVPVSNWYSLSTGTQGRSRRLLLIFSFRLACSASSRASSSRAACHSSRVPILCSA